MKNDKKSTKINVKQKNKAPQKVKVKFEISAKQIKLELIEALQNLPKADFRKVIKVAKQLRIADGIAIRAIWGVDE